MAVSQLFPYPKSHLCRVSVFSDSRILNSSQKSTFNWKSLSEIDSRIKNSSQKSIPDSFIAFKNRCLQRWLLFCPYYIRTNEKRPYKNQCRKKISYQPKGNDVLVLPQYYVVQDLSVRFRHVKEHAWLH